MRGNLAIMVMLAAAVATAAAQEPKIYRAGDGWVEEMNGTLPAARNLKLTTDMGSVRIQGTSANQISYNVRLRVHAWSEEEARRELQSLKISASLEGDTARIRGEAENDNLHDFSADFTVQVPRSMATITAHTGGGGLTVTGIDARVDAQTGGGNIRLDDLRGPVDAQSGGGNVEAGHVGSQLKIETGGGNVNIQSVDGGITVSSGGGNISIDSGKDMDLETGGGGIHVGHAGGYLKASTGGGIIAAGDVSGRAELETGGGAIQLASAGGAVRVETGGGSVQLHRLAGGAEAETGAGSITAEFVGGAKFTSSRLETAAGDIRVYLPANLKVTVDASIDISDGHTIHTDFSGLKVTQDSDEDYGPRETQCHGDLNGGGAALHVHTTTGNIDILRTAASRPQ